MRLFEYQGKILLNKDGIKTPNSYLVDSPANLPYVKLIKFPVVAKVQTLAPGRGEYGGVQKCANILELMNFIDDHLDQNFRNEIVSKILIEELIQFQKEFYFAFRINSLDLCIDLIFSNGGGNGVEERVQKDPSLVKIVHIDPLEPLFLFDTNSIAKSLGFSGDELKEVSDLIFKLYHFFIKYDAKLVEINPVVLTVDKQLYALDAIVQLDDDASYRQSLGDEIGPISEERPREMTPREQEALSIDKEDYRGAVHYIDLDENGDIGLLSVGSGFSITVLDILRNFGINPANFCDCSGNPSKEKVAKAAKLILKIPGIKAFLFISGMVSQPLDVSAEGLIMAIKEVNPKYPIFVRMAGNQENEAGKILKNNGIENIFLRQVSVEEVIMKVKELI